MKTKSFIYGIVATCTMMAIYSFTNREAKPIPVAPLTTISVEDAKMHRALFLENNSESSSDVTFYYRELKAFVDYLEYQKEQGQDIESVRVYLSEYEDGTRTGFMAPIKADKSPNYNVSPMNWGQSGWPPDRY